MTQEIEHAPFTESTAHARLVTWLAAGSNLDPRFGGVSAIVGQLSSAVESAGGFRMSLAQFGEEDHRMPFHGMGPVARLPLSNAPWLSPAPWQDLRNAIRGAEGVHIHGIWQKHCAFTAFLARAMRKPYIVSAHGMLDPWALGDKSWKKSAYTALIEKRNLSRAACLHALTKSEAEDYRNIAGPVPVAIIPNGVEIRASKPDLFFDLFPDLRNRQLILFLGRIHYKKGINLLIEAWSQIRRRWSEAHLVLAGPDFGGTQAIAERLVADLDLTPHVTFTGMLQGEEKWSAFSAAHCFVLPSYSEGLSVSVLEAMGSGVPVLITPQCHLPEVREAGAGWIAEPNAAALAPVLEQALATSGENWRRMGNCGRALVAERYTWDTISAQMAELYRWILGGPKPELTEVF